jgi:hypothetical protein
MRAVTCCNQSTVFPFSWQDKKIAEKAKRYGIRSVPAVVIDGKLADCCAGRGVQETSLRAAGMLAGFQVAIIGRF